MVDAGSIWVYLRLNADGLTTGLTRAKAGLVEWRDETNANTCDMLKWGSAITATLAPLAAATAAYVAATEKYERMATELRDLSYTTDISTQQLQRMQYAALLSNTSNQTLSMSLNTLTLRMNDYGDSTKAADKAFRDLGVDPTGKRPDQVFKEIASAIVSIEDPTHRAAVGEALMGKGWKEMLLYMETYIKDADKIAKAPVWTDDQNQKLIDAKTRIDNLSNSVTILAGSVLAYYETLSQENEAMNSNPSYLEQWLGNTFGDKSGGRKGAGGRGGEISPSASPATPDNSWASAIFGGESEGHIDTALEGIENITDALKDQKNAIDDLTEARKELNDITKDYAQSQEDLDKDYARQLSMVNTRDVSAVMNLSKRHQFAEEDLVTGYQRESAAQQIVINKAQEGVDIAGGKVAKAAMGFALTINGNVTVNGDKSLERKLNDEYKNTGGTVRP